MKQKAAQKFIYKIHTKQLKRSNWNLNMPLETAIREYPDLIVSINDSQMLRWIDELNGVTDYSERIRTIRNRIQYIKNKPKSRQQKQAIREAYDELYHAQFQRDYVCVVMDSSRDYDRANQGFTINGITYGRLLGTNGGVKTSTIVYVNAELLPELKKRINNGRDMDKELVPAKFEAYCALTCSGSTPVPQPKNIIVVHDCMTKFRDSVILINTDTDGEPELKEVSDYEIEHDASDGNGFLSPSYSRKLNLFLNGDGEHTLSGVNCRCAWTKGMLYTFDFVEFAEKVVLSFYVKDVWGDLRDVREADVILTESMLKLWDSYDSMEDYMRNCEENHYQFAVTKDTPEKLENVRDTNYQFLQDLQMDDQEIHDLCQPTIDEINDILGGDYRKSLAYLCGFGMNERGAEHGRDDYVKALMVEPEMINDPFVRKSIHSMIRKRIDSAKKGSIRIRANFAMIGGDLYALAQSMFGLEVTGLLKKGEIYHRYWIDRGAEQVSCFRAPMTSIHNIRKMKLNSGEEAMYWFRYVETACLINAWDTMSDALNGCDFDGDTVYTTDNPVILKNTTNATTLMCMQKKATKRVPTEEAIVEGNKLAFNDDIGVVTNHVTSMIERCAGFDADSEEYRILRYRIMCGQAFQQETIDRIKGIVCEPMPSYWYSYRDIDKLEDGRFQEICRKICAPYKPYFMRYVYADLNKNINDFEKGNARNSVRRFADRGVRSLDGLRELKRKTKEIMEFLSHEETDKKIGRNACTINKICWHFEKVFPSYQQMAKPSDFDYRILKSNVEYAKKDYNAILALYQEYRQELQQHMKFLRKNGYITDDELPVTTDDFVSRFYDRAQMICPDDRELCDIVLDICYQKEGSKQFAWDVAGQQIIRNLLEKHDWKMSFPAPGGEEFQYGGEWFEMKEIAVGKELSE